MSILVHQLFELRLAGLDRRLQLLDFLLVLLDLFKIQPHRIHLTFLFSIFFETLFAVTSPDHDHIIAHTAISKQAAMRTNFYWKKKDNSPGNFDEAVSARLKKLFG